MHILFRNWIKAGPAGAGGRRLWGWVAGGVLAANAAFGQGQGWVGQNDYATPYAFTTIAGTYGVPGYTDGTNQAALFNSPYGAVLDTNGNVYVVDSINNDVRQLRQAGTNWVVTTIAGFEEDTGNADGMNDAIRFNEPTSIAIDGAGNLYVTDSFNNSIRKLTRTGTNWSSSTISGPFAFNNGALGGGGIAVGATNLFYVADTFSNVIRQVTLLNGSMTVTTIAGTPTPDGGFSDGTNQAAQFNNPGSIAMDHAGNLFVGDAGNLAIRKLTPVGTNWVVTTIAGGPENGIPTAGVDGTNEDATFYSPIIIGPMAIAVDANDNLYVADAGDDLIRKVSPAGTNWVTTTLAGLYGDPGNDDGTGTNATFGVPTAIAVDSLGRLFVGDYGNTDIREGTLATVVAGPPNLAISRAARASGLTIWWPGSGYALETNANLATTNWGIYGGIINTNNGTNSVTVTAPAGHLFFRLSD